MKERDQMFEFNGVVDKCEGLPVTALRELPENPALVNKGPYTTLHKQSISSNDIIHNGGRDEQ